MVSGIAVIRFCERSTTGVSRESLLPELPCAAHVRQRLGDVLIS